MATKELPFQKKELEVNVLNPTNLPTIDYHKLSILQGSLKTLSETNRTKLCKSILENGFFIPAFVWRSGEAMYILDATQRYHALEELERKGYSIPAIPYIKIEAKDKKDAAKKLLQITSRYGKINPETTFFTDFDIEIDYLNEISIPELDLAFEDLDSKAIEEDEVPEEAITRVGDLWLCGKHRVLCGEATKAEDVGRVMQGKKADMVFTSPPYNANSHLNIFNKEKNKWESKKFYGDKNEERDNKSSDEYLAFNELVFNRFKEILNRNANIFYNLGYNKKSRSEFIGIVANAINNGFMLFETIVWEKRGMPIPDTQSMSRNYEFIFLFNQSKEYYTNLKYAEYNSNLWKVSNNNVQEKELKACFPVELPIMAIKDYCPAIAIIFDPFLGSGTTLIAADQLNRICYGIEIEPQYVDVILERYHNLTGIDPIREDSKKWSEIKSI